MQQDGHAPGRTRDAPARILESRTSYVPDAARQKEARWRVAAAWFTGRTLRTPYVWTDGTTLYSLGRVIGVTERDDLKVAVTCRRDAATIRHSEAVQAVADIYRDCDCAACRGRRW